MMNNRGKKFVNNGQSKNSNKIESDQNKTETVL